MKYSIFVDFDRTLYDHDNNCVHKKDIEALQEAKENGHLIFLATGRPHINLENIIPKNIFDGYIFSCGAKIDVGNKNIYSCYFDQNEAKLLIQSLLEHKIDFSIDENKKRFLTPYAMNILENRYKNNRSKSNIFLTQKVTSFPIKDLNEIDYSQILKITLYGKNYDLCQQFINNFIKNYGNKYRAFLSPHTSEKFTGGEISLKSVNKAEGMKKILTFLNLPNKNTIAIGDSKNDIEMLRFSCIGVCMKNGEKEAKNAADFITKSINNCGVSYALNTLLNYTSAFNKKC